ncbi:sulfurtransferase TusA family protein [Spiribacter pallidus]|jgi:tRNA 2-thiouridine synthesizing protein A|uniref:Sulfurtransferase TusA family protein n=1 Tax=Spiribacter pallidus TaxID=1987936 RepID=A0ABV3TDK4_9GAMM
MALPSQVDFHRDLDVRGLNCPLPILRTKQALRDMAAGERLRVRATDPHSVIDFRGFCDTTEHRLLAHDEADGVFTFWLEKG